MIEIEFCLKDQNVWASRRWFKLSMFWQRGGPHIVCGEYKTDISSRQWPFSQKFSSRGWPEVVLQWQPQCRWNFRCSQNSKSFPKSKYMNLFAKVALIMLPFLIDKSLSQLATCNPQNRECSCADTSSRVSDLCFKSFLFYRFMYTVFLNHQFKYRTVRISFHQRGSMWTILRGAWTCARCQD